MLGEHFLRMRVWKQHIFTENRIHKVLISDDNDCHVFGPSARPSIILLSLFVTAATGSYSHCTVVSDRNCKLQAAHKLTDMPGDAFADRAPSQCLPGRCADAG